MSTTKPGESTGDNDGIFQEVGPKGGGRPNDASVADNKQPPTTEPGNTGRPVKTAPPSKRWSANAEPVPGRRVASGWPRGF